MTASRSAARTWSTIAAALVVVAGLALAAAPFLTWHRAVVTSTGAAFARTGLGDTSVGPVFGTGTSRQEWLFGTVPDGAFVVALGVAAVAIGLVLLLGDRSERTALPWVLVVIGLAGLVAACLSLRGFRSEIASGAERSAVDMLLDGAIAGFAVPEEAAGGGAAVTAHAGVGLVVAMAASVLLVVLGIVTAASVGATRRAYAARIGTSTTSARWAPPTAAGVTRAPGAWPPPGPVTPPSGPPGTPPPGPPGSPPDAGS